MMMGLSAAEDSSCLAIGSADKTHMPTGTSTKVANKRPRKQRHMKDCHAYLAPEEAAGLELKDCVHDFIQRRRYACSLLPVRHVRIILQRTPIPHTDTSGVVLLASQQSLPSSCTQFHPSHLHRCSCHDVTRSSPFEPEAEPGSCTQVGRLF